MALVLCWLVFTSLYGVVHRNPGPGWGQYGSLSKVIERNRQLLFRIIVTGNGNNGISYFCVYRFLDLEQRSHLLTTFGQLGSWGKRKCRGSERKKKKKKASMMRMKQRTKNVQLHLHPRYKKMLLNWSEKLNRNTTGMINTRGGVLEIVLGLEDTFWSSWPWPQSLKSLKIAQSSARGQHYFLSC